MSSNNVSISSIKNLLPIKHDDNNEVVRRHNYKIIEQILEKFLQI